MGDGLVSAANDLNLNPPAAAPLSDAMLGGVMRGCPRWH